MKLTKIGKFGNVEWWKICGSVGILYIPLRNVNQDSYFDEQYDYTYNV